MRLLLPGLLLLLSSSCASPGPGPSELPVPAEPGAIVLVEVAVLSEQREAFIEELHAILPDTRAFEGCLAAGIWTHSEDPDKVWIYEEWVDRDAQAAYGAWRGQSGTVAHLEAYMQGPMRLLWIEEHHAD